MKLQYLGDSKDSFKWDYHDYLVNELGYPLFNIALMMTPDDATTEGSSRPSLFPARPEILDFCKSIKEGRSIDGINALPDSTSLSCSSYSVEIHNGGEYITSGNRAEYFRGYNGDVNQLLFLDPDNGFEPEKSFNEKHVLYSDLETILNQVSGDSVVSVFQHFRRMSFIRDFERIKGRLLGGYSTAIFWHSLMFVQVSRSEQVINRVKEANIKYSEGMPVEVI